MLVSLLIEFLLHLESFDCGNNNGGCSHICLPTSSERSCACPTGYKMLNSTHCSPSEYIFFESELAKLFVIKATVYVVIDDHYKNTKYTK